MDQYVEKVIRMDEKIDRLIQDVKDMKSDISVRVSNLEKDKAGREDIKEFKVLLERACEGFATAVSVAELKREIEGKVGEEGCKYRSDNFGKEQTELRKEVTELRGIVDSHTNYRWWLAGAMAAMNFVMWLATLWLKAGKPTP